MGKTPKKVKHKSNTRFKYLLLILLVMIILLIVGLYQKSQRTDTQPKSVNAIKSVENDKITASDTIDAVRNLPEVKDYLKEVPGAKVVLDHEEPETNSYFIQVFEVKNGHTNTFNWYKVDKNTGKITAEFDIPSVQGE